MSVPARDEQDRATKHLDTQHCPPSSDEVATAYPSQPNPQRNRWSCRRSVKGRNGSPEMPCAHLPVSRLHTRRRRREAWWQVYGRFEEPATPTKRTRTDNRTRRQTVPNTRTAVGADAATSCVCAVLSVPIASSFYSLCSKPIAKPLSSLFQSRNALKIASFLKNHSMHSVCNNLIPA